MQSFAHEVSSPATPDKSARSPGQTTSESAKPASSVFNAKAIRPVGTLHCTLGVMSLDKDKFARVADLLASLDLLAMLRDAARQAQQNVQATATSDSGKDHDTVPPLHVELKGLVSMHPPKSTSILYCSPSDPTGRLYHFCQALREVFLKNGFLEEAARPLILHATIVNTVYAKGRKRNGRPAAPKPQVSTPAVSLISVADNGEKEEETPEDDRSQGHGVDADNPLKIDATDILERYKDFVWAEDLVFDRVAVCAMGAKKILDDAGNVVDEEYAEVATLPLPH